MRLTGPTAAFALVLTACGPGIKSADRASGDANANPSSWPAAASPATITDAAVEAQIGAILAKMTVEQKVGQLIQADISAIKPGDLARYPLGSILAGGNSGPYGNERSTAAQWNRLVTAFRDASRNTGARIPILFGVDAVHGHSNLPGATIFPHNIGLGAAHDPELLQRIGSVTATEIAASGIEWTFAPTLAAPQDLRWGRSYEGYTSDPELIAAYARAMTIGLQGELVAGKPIAFNRVAATAKHFLADGGTADGRDQGNARIGETELIARHAQGYPAAINAGALTVMVSFSSWNGVKHHGNATLLNGVLKGRMGFKGLVVGDWNGHGQVEGCSASNCPSAINAGLDLFMAPDSWKKLFASTVAAARAGTIPQGRLDDAVRRILRVKFKLGLMGDTPVSRGDPAQIGTAEHAALAREAVSKSLVLLKNNAGVLPIRKGARVLIAGSGADNMAMQAGGWTITWQGTDTTAADFPNGQTIGRAIVQAVDAAGGNAALSPLGDFQTKPDVAIVVVGEKPYAEFEGDVPNLAFQPKQNEAQLIAKLKSQGVPVVVLLLSGRPMFNGALFNQADAFVAGWLPGTQGGGVADVLVAGANGKPARDFTGRLPFAWPADARSPLVNPLFAVGYGLNYAQTKAVGPVNQDPRVDIASLAHLTSYLVRGKVGAPWRLTMDGSVSTKPVDIGAQENAQKFAWNSDGIVSIEGPAINLQRPLANAYALMIDWRIDRPVKGPIKVELGGAAIDLQSAIASMPVGRVGQTRIPLRCFKAAGARFDAVGSPFQIKAPKGFAATFRTIQIEAADKVMSCPAKSTH